MTRLRVCGWVWAFPRAEVKKKTDAGNNARLPFEDLAADRDWLLMKYCRAEGSSMRKPHNLRT